MYFLSLIIVIHFKSTIEHFHFKQENSEQNPQLF